MYKIIYTCFIALAMLNCNAQKRDNTKSNIQIPFAGNAYVTKADVESAEKITANGLENWTSTNAIISCYFRISKSGMLTINLQVEKAFNKNEIEVTVLQKKYLIKTKVNKTNYFVCNLKVETEGYVEVILQGKKKFTTIIATKPSLILSGTATIIKPAFANDSENFYWSRRGPSCHLNYTIPKGDVLFFYSEITVPKGEDKIGSYFMANGFADGYFGIQVNSENERRVLFSVWEEDGKPKTILLQKGDSVVSKRFDGEGTGGQSYMLYNWRADVAYKFLTKGEPDGEGNTIYTSWFFEPEKNQWQLMASFKRQAKSTYLKNFHSFLENFIEDNGYLGRKAYYHNQWIKTKNGDWQPITQCTFSVDATGKNKQRLDFAGGIENGKYFLQNGGFFNSTVLPKTVFTLENKSTAPVIEIE